MENGVCENLSRPRHHGGAQHNTEHLSSFLAETEKWKKHARCWNVFIAHCHSCTANTCHCDGDMFCCCLCSCSCDPMIWCHYWYRYSAQFTFSCLPCFAKKYGIFWLITAHNRSVVTNTGLWHWNVCHWPGAGGWWPGELTAKWQNYSQLFTNCPFLSEPSICNYTLDWQTNSGTSM